MVVLFPIASFGSDYGKTDTFDVGLLVKVRTSCAGGRPCGGLQPWHSAEGDRLGRGPVDVGEQSVMLCHCYCCCQRCSRCYCLVVVVIVVVVVVIATLQFGVVGSGGP